MKDFNSIIESAIKSCSSILVKDSIEILKLKSSASSSLDEFCVRSLVRFYQVLYSKLKFLAGEYSFLFLGNFPEIEAVNTKIKTEEKLRRLIINVDGYSLFSIGLPNYSISVCIQEKNGSGVFDTYLAFVFSPCDNRFFCGERDRGLSLNGVKFKRSSVPRNYSILSTIQYLPEKYNKYYTLVHLKNINLGFVYLAAGSVDLFLTKFSNKKEALAGLFILQICAIPVKINKLDSNAFMVECGFYL